MAATARSLESARGAAPGALAAPGPAGEELARLDKEQAEEAQRLASAGERLEQDEAALASCRSRGGTRRGAAARPGAGERAERALEERLRREQQQAACQRLQLEQQNQRQLITLREQELARLGLELAELKEPGAAPSQDLSPLLVEQRNLEAQQLACHQRLAELDRQLTELEQARSADHKQLVKIQEKLATLRLERERNLTRRQGTARAVRRAGRAPGGPRSGGADCR